MIMILVVCFFSCERVDLEHIDNLNNGRIDVIGHAGSGFQNLINPLPSNSFVSIKKAVDALNADGIEIDVKVSRDSTCILFHDNVLEMGTNCIGCPESYTGQELIRCKYKNYYGAMVGDDQNLLSFQRMINHFQGRKKLPHIIASTKLSGECSKLSPDMEEKYARAISRIIGLNKAYSWISVYDGDPNVLKRIRFYDPDIHLIYNAQDFEGGLKICLENNFNEMVIGMDHVTREQIREAHQNNIKVTLWGMQLRKQIVDAINMHPDALMTDNIPLTQEILRK